ncbi:MAG: hypothetical protein ACKVQB_05745 [Bacteroidia bacterium]
MKSPRIEEIVILILLAFISCNKKASNEKKTPFNKTGDASLIITVKPIKPDLIIAKFDYPNIIIYKDSTGYNGYNIRFTDDGIIKDEGFWCDAKEIIYPETFQIDTIRLMPGKYPQLIFRWIQEGYNSYGCGSGGSYSKTEVFQIYDLNKMDEIFITFPLNESAESPCPNELDSATIVDAGEPYPVDEHHSQFRIQLNKQKKTITIDNLIWTQNGKNEIYPDNVGGTYIFNGDHFELKK